MKSLCRFAQIIISRALKFNQVDAAYEWTTDGGKTFPERGNGHTIPTLEEVFKEFGEAYPNLVFYLDFKAWYSSFLLVRSNSSLVV